MEHCLKNGCAFVDSKGAMCRTCGFNRTVDRWRRLILQQHGLTLDRKTGLGRLVLNPKGAAKSK